MPLPCTASHVRTLPSPNSSSQCPSTASPRFAIAELHDAMPLLLIVLLRLCRSLVLQHPAFAPPNYSALCLRRSKQTKLRPHCACPTDAMPSPGLSCRCYAFANRRRSMRFRSSSILCRRLPTLYFASALSRSASLCPRYELPNNALTMRSLPLFTLAKHIYTVAGLCHEQP